MYRLIMILINLAGIVYMIYLTIELGVKMNDLYIVIPFFLLPILNATYIYFSKVSKDKEPWLITLYFRRKALEEKKKVQSLQKELDQKKL